MTACYVTVRRSLINTYCNINWSFGIMPAWIEDSEKASALRRRAAKLSRDRAVTAQRKNKLEAAQLSIYHAILDRKKVRTTVCSKREQDELRQEMRHMRKTTGFSKQGLPPSGPNDSEHEKSPYFQTVGHVSEKRLQKWKNDEQALQRILLSEEEMRPPWEKGNIEVAEDTLGHLLNLLGYEKEEAKVMVKQLQDNEVAGEELNQRLPAKDTKEDKQHINGSSVTGGGTVNKSKLRSASTSSFSGISSWVSDPNGRIDVFECLRDVNPVGSESSGQWMSYSTKRQGSVSAEDIHQPGFSVRDWERQLTERYKNKLINPTGNNERGAGENKSRRSRPQSAPVKIGTVQKLAELQTDVAKDVPDAPDPIPVEAHLRPPHVARHRTQRRPLTAIPPRAVQATRGLMMDKSQPRTDFRRQDTAPPQSSSQGHQDGRVGTEGSLITPHKPPVNAKCEWRLEKERLHESETEQCSESNADGLNNIAEEGEEGSNATSRYNRITKATLPVGGRRRFSSVGTVFPARGGTLPSGGHAFKRSNSLPVNNTLIPNMHIGDIHKHLRRHTLLVVDDSGEKEGDADPGVSNQSGEDDLRAQWRRKLIKDAPPGFSGRNEKVKLALSKSQLRRDMQQMVTDHEDNIKDKIRQEHVRRMRTRMDIVMTLEKLAKKHEGGAESETMSALVANPAKLATKVNAIMQVMRLRKEAQTRLSVVKEQEETAVPGEATS